MLGKWALRWIGCFILYCMPQSKGAACHRARGLHAYGGAQGSMYGVREGVRTAYGREGVRRTGGKAHGVREGGRTAYRGGGAIRVPLICSYSINGMRAGGGAIRVHMGGRWPAGPAGWAAAASCGGACLRACGGGFFPRAPMCPPAAPCSSECRAAGWTSA